MRNKRGNIFFGITIGIFVFMFGVLLIPFIVDDVDTFRTNMDCSNADISDASKLSCLFGDLTIPYFIWFFVSALIGFIGGSIR